MEFKGFPKMARLSRDICVSEKLDGTNAQVVIINKMEYDNTTICGPTPIAESDGLLMFAGSRNRWIRPGDDNFGFALWCKNNSTELFKLGEGQHFGEWWGNGIGRGYGLAKDDKRFSLFNTHRWTDDAVRPACCSVVPVLYHGAFDSYIIDNVIDGLMISGSVAAPGFMKPEGIIVFHTAAGIGFKKTCEDDGIPKSLAALHPKAQAAAAGKFTYTA